MSCWMCNTKTAKTRLCGGCFWLRYRLNDNMRRWAR